MIYLNTYKFDIDGEELTAAEISKRWPNGVEVRGRLDISDLGLKEIPFKIKSVGEDFWCHNNKLTSLIGCPEFVGRHFWCYNNQLTSLEGCPKKVGEDFWCYDNQLTSLEGCPETVCGGFECDNNQLTSLKCCPKSVGGSFHCENNQLTSLVGGPKSVGKGFYCDWLILMHSSDISKYIPIINNHFILSYYNYITNTEKHIPVEYADNLLNGDHKKNQQVINNLLKFASSEAIKHFYTK